MDLQFFAVREFSGEISNQIYQQVRWVKLEDLTEYEFPAADRGLIKRSGCRQTSLGDSAGISLHPHKTKKLSQAWNFSSFHEMTTQERHRAGLMDDVLTAAGLNSTAELLTQNGPSEK